MLVWAFLEQPVSLYQVPLASVLEEVQDLQEVQDLEELRDLQGLQDLERLQD